MKKRLLVVLALIVAASAAPALHAEQQFTLKFDGQELVVTIADGEHRVPLTDVAPPGVGQNDQARRLLMAALEARVLGGSPREAVGLISEAARLAPDDPQIAFWYASTLVDAGSGNAAIRILEKHRAAIEAEFPDRIEKLAKRIDARMNVELLPEELVVRLDALHAATASQPADAEQRTDFAAFRVVDQFDAPIERSAIQVNGNLNDQRIEEYSDGYYLVTFTRRRNQSNDPCQLQVGQYGLLAAQFEVRPASGQVVPAEEFVVHRYEDADKKTFRGLVVDRNGDPIAGARVSLERSANNDGVDRSPNGVADEDGRIEFQAFPGPYAYSATADGYTRAGQQIELPAEGQAPEWRLVLHRAIVANIRVEWRGAPMQGFGGGVRGGGLGGAITGETILVVNGGQRGAPPYNQEVMWLRPIQVEDRLTLNFNLMIYGGMPLAGEGGSWVKRWSAADEAEGDEQQRLAAAQEQFDKLNLEELGELPESFETVNVAGPNFGPGNIGAPAKVGDVFVGRLIGRDPRSGQPLDTTFKAIVEPVEDDGGE